MTRNGDTSLPSISIIIPFLDEEVHLARCLEAALAQTYPPERIEILAVDGGSSDRSRQIVEEFGRRDARIRLLDNPRRNAAGGLNVGLAQAGGDILLRLDAHTILAPDYVETCVRLLEQRPEIGNAGGPLRPIGETEVGRAIALALRSPFSMGGSPFRYAAAPRPADTVYLGAYRRRDLDAVGQFDVSLGANEDYEFNYRLRRAGWIIWCDPAVRSQTFTRRTLGDLARQYARYGFWKARVVWLHPRSVLPRHLIAPLTLLLFLAGLSLAARGRWLPALLLAAGYAALNLGASWAAGWPRRRPALWLPLVFALMHLCWAVGFLGGIVPAILAGRRTPQ